MATTTDKPVRKKKSKIIETTGIVSHMQRETIDTQTLRIKMPFLDEENKPFQFKPGQFVMVRPEIEGKTIPRAYSISSSPTRALDPENGFFDLTVRQTETPTVSKWLNDRKVGDEIVFRGPYGHFFWNEEDPEAQEVFMLGGGSGITPLKSILEYIHDKKLPNKVSLMYSCRYNDDIILEKELNQLHKDTPNSNVIVTLSREKDDTGWMGRRGRIDLNLIKQELAERNFDMSRTKCYLCGTPPFVNNMVDLLQEAGFSKDRILHEKWD